MADTTLSYVVGGNLNGRPPTSMVGRAPTVIATLNTKLNVIGASVSAGAMTAGVLKALVTLTAPGVLKVFALQSLNATARTLQGQIIIDGVTVLDLTSVSIAASNSGVVLAGYVSSNSADNWVMGDRIPFNTLTLNAAISTTDSGLGYYLVYDLV